MKYSNILTVRRKQRSFTHEFSNLSHCVIKDMNETIYTHKIFAFFSKNNSN